MDFKMIEAIIKAVENSSINIFEFELDGAKIKLQKTPDGNIKSVSDNETKIMGSGNKGYSGNANNSANQGAEVFSNVEKVKKNDAIEKYHVIKSPIVGAYYESPIPGKSAFVKVGDRVTKGKTVCIIEAMKVMNEIESDVDGVVIEILASDGKMVEFGQVLFKIEAD